MKKQDIQNRKDIERLVDAFYAEVKADPELKHFFLKVNWEKHLPIMYDFWENVVFYTGGYSGNPMEKHKHILNYNPLRHEDFEKWIFLFSKTAQSLFSGKNTKLILQRAKSIATIMEIKILGQEELPVSKK